MTIEYPTAIIIKRTADVLEVTHSPSLMRWLGSIAIAGVLAQVIWAGADTLDQVTAALVILLGLPLILLTPTKTLIANARSRKLVVTHWTLLHRRQRVYAFDEVRDVEVDGDISNEAMNEFAVWLVMRDGRREALSAELSVCASRDNVRDAVCALRAFIVPQKPSLW
jgi:hypothetical protein